MNKVKEEKNKSLLSEILVYVSVFTLGCCALLVLGAFVYAIYLFIDLKVNGGPMYYTIEYQEKVFSSNDPNKITITKEIDKNVLTIFVHHGYVTESQMENIKEVLGNDRVELVQNDEQWFVMSYRPPVSKSITECDKKRVIEEVLKTVNPNLYGRIYDYQHLEVRCTQ